MKTGMDKPSRQQGNAVDWSEIHSRMETAREELGRGAEPSAEEKLSILRSRARDLAREPEKAAEGRGFIEIIEFRLAFENYGIESAFVLEVYPLTDYTPLPGTPPFVLGIINVRGRILSVVDLKKFFNLPDKGIGELNKVIIIRNAGMEFGILADAILGARSIPLDGIQAAPQTVTGIGAEYLKGVCEERLIVLDAEKILNDEKIIVHQEID
ncbi:MAG: chemotaxis protein CheW [bacterium]